MPAWISVVLLAATLSSERVSMEKHPIAPGAKYSYEVSAAPCRNYERTLEVRVVDSAGAAVLASSGGASVALEWPTACDLAPSDPEAEGNARWEWMAGEESSGSWARVTPIRLAPDLNGMLIEREAGFEHVHRRQDLVVRVGTKLQIAWSGEEGSGPTFSHVEIMDAAGGAQQLRWQYTFGCDCDEYPDRYEVYTVGWNAKKKKVESLRTPVWAAIFGAYDDVPTARAAAEKLRTVCDAWPKVVASEEFPKLKAGKLVLGTFAATKEEADAALLRATKCGGAATDSYVKRVR